MIKFETIIGVSEDHEIKRAITVKMAISSPLDFMVRMIAGFGGFLGHKSDGHPEVPMDLWEGME